jgi:uncharacterized protein DUF5677
MSNAGQALMSPGAPQERRVTFGYEEFWSTVYEQHERQFAAIAELMGLANEMLQAAEQKATEPVEKVVHELTRATTAGANDVILLCGNGCGVSALKIVRGMFESSWTAEYLRRNPKEVDDYIDFGRILSWRRYQWLLIRNPDKARLVSPETVKNNADAYNQVKARFTNANGRERNQWSNESIGKMAEEIGRKEEYDLPYSLACSFHHANAEGLLAYVSAEGEEIGRSSPPSMDWLTEALISAHTNLWFTLDTLNDCCNLEFTDKLKTAEENMRKAWGK